MHQHVRRIRHNFLHAALFSGLLMLQASSSWSATTERPDNELRHILTEAIESSDSFTDRFDAEVWLTDMSRRLGSRVEDPEQRMTVLKTVHYEAQRAKIEPEIILALIEVESNYDPFAISSAGARGLMQIMPFWLDEIGHPDDNLFHIGTNIRFGCTILSYYLKRERGNMHRALARYNGSVGKHWYPNRIFNALRKRWYKQ
ncbi:MAG: lytic transglycosylase domain-containing protein [Gammaproteobacteria bacterium]